MTIVGIFPDNVAIPQVPGTLPKIAVYLKGTFPSSEPPKTFSVRLDFPWEPRTLSIGKMGDMTAAAEASRKQGNDAVGYLLWAGLANFGVLAPGRIKAIATIDGEEWEVGSLNIVIAEPAAASARAEPPTDEQATEGERKRRRKRVRRVPAKLKARSA